MSSNNVRLAEAFARRAIHAGPEKVKLNDLAQAVLEIAIAVGQVQDTLAAMNAKLPQR